MPAITGMWPGPNSNTFVATVLRAIPETGISLPPNAIGRDFRPLPYAGLTDSGTGPGAEPLGRAGREGRLGRGRGAQLSSASSRGFDLRNPGVKLPGFGRIGFDGQSATAAPL